ncbi:MAG: transcription termination factor NusA [Campylobacterota bacterium]
MEKIGDIIESIALEKGLKKEEVNEAFERALIFTAKEMISPDQDFSVEIEGKNYTLYQTVHVVADDDEHLQEESEKYIALSEAKELDPDVEVGDQLQNAIHIEDFGRTAAAKLFYEVELNVQKVIEQNLFEKYKAKVGTIVHGSVIRVDNDDNTFIEIDELRGILPRRNRIKGESFKKGDVVRALLKFVNMTKKEGMHLDLTRTSPEFLNQLIKKEVPEVQDDYVEIVGSARIPGERAKVAVKTAYDIDPVGAVVGVKGTRVNAVSQQLRGENIDVIEHSAIPEIFIARCLAPAVVNNITIEDDVASVKISPEQKPRAIGKSGINIRLTSMLSGYRIELIEEEGAAKPEYDQDRGDERSNDSSALEALFN